MCRTFPRRGPRQIDSCRALTFAVQLASLSARKGCRNIVVGVSRCPCSRENVRGRPPTAVEAGRRNRPSESGLFRRPGATRCSGSARPTRSSRDPVERAAQLEDGPHRGLADRRGLGQVVVVGGPGATAGTASTRPLQHAARAGARLRAGRAPRRPGRAGGRRAPRRRPRPAPAGGPATAPRRSRATTTSRCRRPGSPASPGLGRRPRPAERWPRLPVSSKSRCSSQQ